MTRETVCHAGREGRIGRSNQRRQCQDSQAEREGNQDLEGLSCRLQVCVCTTLSCASSRPRPDLIQSFFVLQHKLACPLDEQTRPQETRAALGLHRWHRSLIGARRLFDVPSFCSGELREKGTQVGTAKSKPAGLP
jgi:hypothetical protein